MIVFIYAFHVYHTRSKSFFATVTSSRSLFLAIKNNEEALVDRTFRVAVEMYLRREATKSVFTLFTSKIYPAVLYRTKRLLGCTYSLTCYVLM